MYSFPHKLERYELASRSWLPTIGFDSRPQGLALIPNGFVVAFETKISRFDPDGDNEQVLLNAWPDPADIVADDGYLFVFKSEFIQSIRLSDGAQVDFASFGIYTPMEVVLSPGANRFFAWTVGRTPPDIQSIGYDHSTGLIDDSIFIGPYHGDYQRGARLFAEPSGQRLLDRSGFAYRGVDLTHLYSLGGYVRDAAFGASGVLLARDQDVALLDGSLREIGVTAETEDIHGVAFAGSDAVLFGGLDGMTVSVHPLASFGPPAVVVPSSPHSAYQPSKVEMSLFGTIHLFDSLHASVHRFDVNIWSHLPSIGLPPRTAHVSLDTQNEHLYVAQTGGRLSVVPRGAARDSFLAHSPPSMLNLGAIDDYLMIADLSGAEASHRVFAGLDGTETDVVTWNHPSLQFTWNRSLRRMYFLSDGSTPSNLHFETVSTIGQISDAGQSPLQESVEAVYPIRVQPAGAYALLGSGQIFDGISLNLLGSLGETISDASWIGTSLYTLRPSVLPGRSELVRWSSAFTPATRGTIPGTPIALFNHNGQLIAVTRVNGFVRFLRYPATLSGTNVATALAVSTASAQAGTALEWSGTVINEGMETAEVSVTLSFNAEPTGLALLCTLDGNPADCTVSTPIIQTLDSGSTLTVQAWGNMPAQSETLIATLAAAAADSRPEDNEVSVSVELDTRLFIDGFEGI